MHLSKKILFLLIISPSIVNADSNIGVMGRLKNTYFEDSFASGIYVSKDTFGMRANAVVMAARANATDGNSYPINGFNYTKSLSRYGSRDSVGLYADNTSSKLKRWERVSSASFTPTSVSSNGIDYSKIKPGMIIDTDGSPSWSGYVISASENKIITNGWVNNETGRLGTPPNGGGIIINPSTKIWATNFNLFFDDDGRARAGVIQENGIINNSINNPNEINGIDTVVLPSSRYGGTAAYLSRSARGGNKQQWLIGFASQGAKNANFYSDDASNERTTRIGYMENSSAVAGMVFSGKNKESSVEWRSSGRVISKFSPDGKLMKISYSTKIIKDSVNIDDNHYKYIVNTNNSVVITLPENKKITDGYTVEIDNFSDTKIKFNSDSKINLSKKVSNSMKATFTNGEWFIM